MTRLRRQGGASSLSESSFDAPVGEDGRAYAEELVAEGRHFDAIRVLNAVNRAQRDLEIERRIIEIRRDAPIPHRRRFRRPPRPPDHFAGVDGLPEIQRDDLRVELTRSAIEHHGGLLVRGLFNPAQVDVMVGDIKRAFAAFDSHAAGAPTSETAPWFVPFEPASGEVTGRPWIRSAGGVIAADSPPALFDLIEIFDAVGVRELVTEFLGELPVIIAKKWMLRLVAPEREADWHQDGAFMGKDIHSINVWVALSHCGDDAPGLEIVADRLDGLAETGTEGAHFDWTVGKGVVAKMNGSKVVRPIFEPGDALIFDHLMLHRTLVTPEMTKDRYAVETWFAAPSTYLDKRRRKSDPQRIRDGHPIAY